MGTADIVQRSIDWIEEHLYEPLDLEQIAGAASMSVPNLYRMFHAMTGHPIKEYIRKRRISEAACLLRQSDFPAIEIGFRCGFDTYQTFIKSFKRYIGLTPGLYRKAELIFSFEQIRLFERVTYLEEREVVESYPEVRVLRLAPQKGIGYMHVSEQEEGLEDEALYRFRSALANGLNNTSHIRLFGWNMDLDGGQPFGYQMVAVGENGGTAAEHPDLQPVELPGGLYAATRVPVGSGPTIVAAWNRLLSEWLPRSTFELGEQGFLEEYQQYRGQIVRMKLYLPVKRRQEKEIIEIKERPPIRVMIFRSKGIDCMNRVDKASTDWLVRNGFVGDMRLQVFMSCSYGISPGESYEYEVCIAPPEDYVPSGEDVYRLGRLEGRLYACLTTRANGLMTGVVERIYRWLSSSTAYAPDEKRTWYTRYVLDESESSLINVKTGAELERLVNVECCVPIIERK